MKWIRERDALIAQTLAFVQSVSGKRDDFRQQDTVTPASTTEFVSVQAVSITVEPQPADLPPPFAVPPQPLPAPPPRMAGDFRSEMQARIANFRQHQERFEREREEYCAATLTKLRAAIRETAPPPPSRK